MRSRGDQPSLTAMAGDEKTGTGWRGSREGWLEAAYGALVREVDLDPEVRAPQDLPIDGPGGDYKIEVLATIAGSKPTWREVCVSELDVLGTAPATPGEHPAVVAIGFSKGK